MSAQRLNLCLGILLLLASSACVSSQSSHGDARIVVMPISGSKAANGAVADLVGSRYKLISVKHYISAAKRLDAKSRDARDIRRVSRKLDIDAMVAGEFVKRSKRRYELRLSLRAGDSGKEFDSVTIKLKSKNLRPRDRRKIKSKLFAALSEVDRWSRDAKPRKGKRRDKKADKRRKKEERRLAKRERRDDDDYDRSKRSKRSKKKRKKKKKERYKVVTERDGTGQALDTESPF